MQSDVSAVAHYLYKITADVENIIVGESSLVYFDLAP